MRTIYQVNPGKMDHTILSFCTKWLVPGEMDNTSHSRKSWLDGPYSY